MDAVFLKEEREGALKLFEIGLWLCGGWIFLTWLPKCAKTRFRSVITIYLIL
jgi:hypothetical protein